MNLIFNFMGSGILLTFALPLWVWLGAAQNASAGQAEAGKLTPAQIHETAQRAVHLLDYVAVDYPGAVDAGRVTSELEYREQRAFLGDIAERLPALGLAADDPRIVELEALRRAVDARAAAETVAARARELAAALRAQFNVASLPPRTPSLERGRELYEEACAACHGATGLGDGPMGRDLDPAPADLTDRERMLALPLSAVFATITFGIEGTAMAGFVDAYDEGELYDLAFYAGSLAFHPAEVARGAAIAAGNAGELARLIGGMTAVVSVPAENLGGASREGRALVAYARTHPEALAAFDVSLSVARERLDASWQAYVDGEARKAVELAISAYLDGLEPVEPRLEALDRKVRLALESDFFRYRELLSKGAPPAVVEPARQRLAGRLDDASRTLSDGDLGPLATFVASLTIVAREGFEAVLLVVALTGLLVRTGRREALPYVHVGWIAALLVGAATWIVARHVIAISGAQRELIEGISSLLASAILFYVSYWLIAQAFSRRWQVFIETRIRAALSRGSLWTLVTISFFAVYREVFETIIFYEAIASQAGPAGVRPILLGAVSGLILLGLLATAAFRYGLRLPVRRFFVISSSILYMLAIVLAGQGVAALQEAGNLPATSIAGIRIEWLGIYPTLEGLAVQLLLVMAAAIAALIMRSHKGQVPVSA